MKPNSVITQIKVIELCFPELLFTLLYKMVVTFFEPFEKDLSITDHYASQDGYNRLSL